jgi:hypothetical protein
MARKPKVQRDAEKVCRAVVEMTAGRRIQHWVMASEVRAKTGLSVDDFAGAVEFAIEARTLESNRHRDSLAVHRERL